MITKGEENKMRYVVDHDYHIHTQLSTCSNDPEQTAERILKYALDNSLKRICVTDHYWDAQTEGATNWYRPQDFTHISSVLPLPQADGVEFLFGAETEFNKENKIGMPLSRFDCFDFVIIPTTHMHITGLTVSEEDSVSENTNAIRAELWVKKLDALLELDLPFCKIGIAHLACKLINKKSFEDYIDVLERIPTSEMERVFAKIAQKGCGVEINQSDVHQMQKDPDAVSRMFRIAKQQGCKFYLGSDAHHPAGLDGAKAAFEYAIDLLGLEESDKFHIG